VAGGRAIQDKMDPQRQIGREMLDQEAGMVARPIDPGQLPQQPMRAHLATALRARGLDPVIVIPAWGLGGRVDAGQAPGQAQGTAIPEQESVNLEAPVAEEVPPAKPPAQPAVPRETLSPASKPIDWSKETWPYKKAGFTFGALTGRPAIKDVLVEETGKNSWRLVHPKEPGIEGTLGSDDGYMSIYLEVIPDDNNNYPAKGTGVSTTLYLRGLQEAQAQGLGWISDSMMSNETHAMYARLKRHGIPFEFDGGQYVLSAEDLKSISIDDVLLKPAADKKAPKTGPDKPAQPVEPKAEKTVLDAAYKAAGDRYSTRVFISDLMERTDLPLEEVHKTLQEMSDADKIALYPIEDPREKTEARTASAVMIHGEANEIAYFEPPAPAERPTDSKAVAKPKPAKPKADPYKAIADIRLPVDVTIRETGERKLDTESAGVLLREADDRISALRQLRGCLSS
jgi:hypothetical protein